MLSILTPLSSSVNSPAGACSDTSAKHGGAELRGETVEAPPATNRGVLNTKVRIDWLECTFNHSQLHIIQEWCNRFDLEDLGHGAEGYDRAAKFAGSGWLLWCSDDVRGESQGVHVSFPSKCLDVLFAHGYNTTQLLSTLDLFNAKVTRIDIAFDDRPQDGQEGLLDLETIIESIKSGQYVSRSRQVRLMQYLAGGEGTTLYFGSGQSDSLLRIYDKEAEQKAWGHHWIRVELQLRRERAHALFLLLENEYNAEDFDAGAVLLAVLDFKTPTDDENKSRWPTAPWWSAFVSTVSKIRLSHRREIVESVERSRRWIDRQVAPTLAFLMKAYQGDMDYLTGVLVGGLQRLSRSKQAVLNSVLEGR